MPDDLDIRPFVTRSDPWDDVRVGWIEDVSVGDARCRGRGCARIKTKCLRLP